MNKVVIIGEVNSQNIGDQAIFYSLSQFFVKRGFEVQGVDLSFSSKKSKDNKIYKNNKTSIVKKLHKYFYSKFRFYTKLVNIVVFLMTFKKKHVFLSRQLKSASHVVIGGGQLLQNNNLSFPLELFLVSRVLKSLNKKYSIVGCGVGHKNWGFLSKYLVSSVLKSKDVKCVLVRDDESIRTLKKFFKIKAEFIPDPAVSLSSFYKVKYSPVKIGLGIMSPNTLRRNKNMLEFNSNDFVDFWVKIYFLVRECYPNNEIEFFTTGDMSDHKFANKISSVLVDEYGEKVSLVPPAKSVYELIESLKNYKFLISMRLHSHIIAYSYKIPSLGIIWEGKVEGFAKYAGITDHFTNNLNVDFFEKILKESTYFNLNNYKEFTSTIDKQIDKILL